MSREEVKRLDFSRSELKILWHFKRNGGVIEDNAGIVMVIADTLEMREGTVGYYLRILENKCVLVRTMGRNRFNKPVAVRAELIDPEMYLPPLPVMPLAAVIAHENDEMYERTNCEPTDEAIILALVTTNEKLRFQINKLQEIVNAQAKEILQLKEHKKHEPRDEHLTQRLKDAIPAEEWDQLHHRGTR